MNQMANLAKIAPGQPVLFVRFFGAFQFILCWEIYANVSKKENYPDTFVPKTFQKVQLKF